MADLNFVGYVVVGLLITLGGFQHMRRCSNSISSKLGMFCFCIYSKDIVLRLKVIIYKNKFLDLFQDLFFSSSIYMNWHLEITARRVTLTNDELLKFSDDSDEEFVEMALQILFKHQQNCVYYWPIERVFNNIIRYRTN